MSDGGRGAAAPLITREVSLPPFRFWETRAGSGTPVVLIHGLGGSSEWWRHTIPELSRTHTVAAVDLVGFGRNRFFIKQSSLPLTFGQVAALLVRWIESSFDEPVHLVGNSMGGQIAIHVAASRPDLVRSLVLVSSTGIPFELKPGLHIENIVVPRGMMSFARVLARDAFRSGPTAITIAFARLLRDDARPLMRLLKMPVLLLWGEHDPLVPVHYAELIHAEIPHAKLVVVPHAGHVSMWENPEFFNRELLDFIASVDAGQSWTPVARPRLFSWAVAATGGIAFRESGTRRHIVLVHGLGMSSAYFRPLARALFRRDVDVIAPDLPGFGASLNAPAGGAVEHAQALIGWADAIGLRDAVWAGHSTGANAVAHVARLRPDLVRFALFMSPVWSERLTIMRRVGELLLDATREPWSLFVAVVRAYWRTGLARWFATFRRLIPDMRKLPDVRVPFATVAGSRDPLLDREATRERIEVPGAHAAHYSHPEEFAEGVRQALRTIINWSEPPSR
jgi:pimeloyl-ACP methyl ester carboxylesterase